MATAVASNELPKHADEAGARLYEEHAEMLLRYCRRQLGSEVEAEDAVQTTFVYALRALRRGVVPDCDEAWLTTIARNVCHWQRRTQARRGPLATDVDLDAFVSPGSEPGDHDELIGLEDALASMPERQRRALVLREWRGAAPAEIARKLDLTPTATHALLTRARSSLALALTVARQPALALVWLAGELKSLVKAIIGSATAKAGVAAVTVVATTGITAGLVETTPAPDRPATDLSVPTMPVRLGPPAVPPGTRSAGDPARGAAASTPTPRLRRQSVTPSRATGPGAADLARTMRSTSAPQPKPPSATDPTRPTAQPTAPRGDDSRPNIEQKTEVRLPSPAPDLPALPALPRPPVPSLPEVPSPAIPVVPPVSLPPVVDTARTTVGETAAETGEVAESLPQPPAGLLP